MQPISPFLWFDTQAEEAANFYVSVFKNSRITDMTRWGEEGPGPAGSVLVVNFELNGQKFIALNGGPEFQFNKAVSFMIHCETQSEIDYYWEKLTEGGEEVQCGWLTDKYGLSWQVAPNILLQHLNDPDREKSDRVMKAMMGMVKIDIAGIEKAYAGE
ncbi:MAG TPA: VOC family protein [Fimbriimonadaceae bacterium]|jgi:predicted 3-demethylubiquinone-9 3-methyltransferase (glyoxalase superfamily)